MPAAQRYKTEKEFIAGLKHWVSKMHKDQPIKIGTHIGYNRAGSWNRDFWCLTCTICSKNKVAQGWRGRATYHKDTGTVRWETTSWDAHDDFARIKGRNQLNDKVRRICEEYIATHDKVTTQDLLRITKGMQRPRPGKDRFSILLMNSMERSGDQARFAGILSKGQNAIGSNGFETCLASTQSWQQRHDYA